MFITFSIKILALLLCDCFVSQEALADSFPSGKLYLSLIPYIYIVKFLNWCHYNS